ncbi:MAG TPA: hypothetical protein DEQ09_11695 [Bacteroidales bacterium]|nr:hypothetical protein [Bacteroidales bacterium]
MLKKSFPEQPYFFIFVLYDKDKKIMMRYIFSILGIVLMIASCTKPNHTPEGPTDVRIRNITDQDFTNVIVDTGGGEHNYGNIAAGAETAYFRFEKAYPNAEVTVMIGGVQYSTGEQDYTYATYIGPDKITYVVYISNPEQKKLEVDVILDGPIDDK